MLYTVIIAVLCLALGAFLGVQLAEYLDHKEKAHKQAFKDYNEHIVKTLWLKGRRTDFDQIEQGTVVAFCEYCVNHNIRKTDIRVQLMIKSLVK